MWGQPMAVHWAVEQDHLDARIVQRNGLGEDTVAQLQRECAVGADQKQLFLYIGAAQNNAAHVDPDGGIAAQRQKAKKGGPHPSGVVRGLGPCSVTQDAVLARHRRDQQTLFRRQQAAARGLGSKLLKAAPLARYARGVIRGGGP